MSTTPDRLSVQPNESARVEGTDEVLADVLRWLRFSGAIFLRAEFTAPWGYESPQAGDLAAALKPGARRLILFHVVAEGACTLSLEDGRQARLEQGDVVILPYAHQHRVGHEADVASVHIGTLLPPQPWTELPFIRYGGGGAQTQIVCGYVYTDDLLFNPVLGALPTLMHLGHADASLKQWVEASFQYAVHASQRQWPPDDLLLQRLPEVLFIECLRAYLGRRHSDQHGWFAALSDPVLGRVLQLIHADYARPWTLDSLAREAGSSRSRLDERFRRCLNSAPMGYLARWRLQVAGQLLRSTTRNLSDIAQSVGYGSEASLSRAFRRFAGTSPAAWRKAG